MYRSCRTYSGEARRCDLERFGRRRPSIVYGLQGFIHGPLMTRLTRLYGIRTSREKLQRRWHGTVPSKPTIATHCGTRSREEVISFGALWGYDPTDIKERLDTADQANEQRLADEAKAKRRSPECRRPTG